MVYLLIFVWCIHHMTTQGSWTNGFEEDYYYQGYSLQEPQIRIDLMSNENIRHGFYWWTQVGIEIPDFYG